MALRYADPCGEYYAFGNMVEGLWNIVAPDAESPLSGPGTAIITGQSACGGDVIQIVPNGVHHDGLGRTFDDQATWIVGFRHKTAALGVERQHLLRLLDNATPQVCVRVEANGQLAVYRGGSSEGTIINPLAGGSTLLGTSTFALNEDEWYYIELKATIHNSTGSFDVHVNGNSVVSGTNVDTQFTSNAFANGVRFCGGRGFASPTLGDFFDDIYVADGQTVFNGDFGGRLTTFAGDLQVQVIRPDADGGTQQDFTPQGTGTLHFDRINDTTPNDATNYLESNTATDEEFNAHANITAGLTVVGVVIVARVQKSAPGPRSMLIGSLEGGITRYGTEEHFPSACNWRYYINPSDKNPATLAQWTAAEVNSNEYGVKVNS